MEQDLKCGAYEGRCFRDPAQDGAAAYVNGERMLELDVEAVPDEWVQWLEDGA